VVTAHRAQAQRPQALLSGPGRLAPRSQGLEATILEVAQDVGAEVPLAEVRATAVLDAAPLLAWPEVGELPQWHAPR
jgi:hypothetical protein